MGRRKFLITFKKGDCWYITIAIFNARILFYYDVMSN